MQTVYLPNATYTFFLAYAYTIQYNKDAHHRTQQTPASQPTQERRHRTTKKGRHQHGPNKTLRTRKRNKRPGISALKPRSQDRAGKLKRNHENPPICGHRPHSPRNNTRHTRTRSPSHSQHGRTRSADHPGSRPTHHRSSSRKTNKKKQQETTLPRDARRTRRQQSQHPSQASRPPQLDASP